MRLLLYVVLAGVVTLLFFTAQQRQVRDTDPRTLQGFYRKTMGAINNKSPGGPPPNPEEERLAMERAERLRAAEQQAKDLANAKAPNRPNAPEDLIGVGSSASGQDKVGAESGEESDAEMVPESEDEHNAEVALDEMLKKSPGEPIRSSWLCLVHSTDNVAVLILSKSYCPHSKKAKGILLEKYAIYPAPHVVELDQHPLGQKIQDKLAVLTGRRTVPNIMINGKSIGGGDEITALDSQKALVEKIQTYGGKFVSVAERFVEDGRET